MSPKPFLNEDFLLETYVAVDLYHHYVKDLPIVDFHGHLPVALVASDHRFRSITELWLDGDHYKWRAMRTNGVPERFCTGDATDLEKFEAWARTVPQTIRNPLYHWTHMELRNPFGVTDLLDGTTARSVWDRVNPHLHGNDFSAQGLLRHFRVAVLCTTDDPVESLEHHAALARREDPDTLVFPTFRPDRALQVDDPVAWNAWVARLEAAAGQSVGSYGDLLGALDRRHAAFHAAGCRASDHGLERIEADPWTASQVEAAIQALRRGEGPAPGDAAALRSALLHDLALLDHARGWVQQFHLGALRNNNTRMRRVLGPDTGFDSIGDFDQARPLARFLDGLDEGDRLAKTILYNLNPRDNELFATMLGNFQDGSVPGKLQWGSAWWFLDQKDGMESQMRALSNLGLFSRFIGMVTDSRSFLSFSRHEYFRRLICNLLGNDVRDGLLPDDRPLLGRVARAIAFFNARDYLGLPMGRLGRGLENDPT